MAIEGKKIYPTILNRFLGGKSFEKRQVGWESAVGGGGQLLLKKSFEKFLSPQTPLVFKGEQMKNPNPLVGIF